MVDRADSPPRVRRGIPAAPAPGARSRCPAFEARPAGRSTRCTRRRRRARHGRQPALTRIGSVEAAARPVSGELRSPGRCAGWVPRSTGRRAMRARPPGSTLMLRPARRPRRRAAARSTPAVEQQRQGGHGHRGPHRTSLSTTAATRAGSPRSRAEQARSAGVPAPRLVDGPGPAPRGVEHGRSAAAGARRSVAAVDEGRAGGGRPELTGRDGVERAPLETARRSATRRCAVAAMLAELVADPCWSRACRCDRARLWTALRRARVRVVPPPRGQSRPSRRRRPRSIAARSRAATPAPSARRGPATGTTTSR